MEVVELESSGSKHADSSSGENSGGDGGEWSL